MNLTIIVFAIILKACYKSCNAKQLEKMSITELQVKPLVGSYQSNILCIDDLIEKINEKIYNDKVCSKTEKIIYTISKDDVDTLKRFHSEGTEYNTRLDSYGSKLIDYALYLGSLKCSEYLIDKVDVLEKIQTMPSPLHFLMLGKMDKASKKIFIEKILNKNPKAFKEKTFDNHNSLMFAAITGDFETFKTIYKQIPKFMDEYTHLGMNVSGYSVVFGSDEIFDFLYKKLDNSNKPIIGINDKDKEGRTALMLACANNREEIFDWLIENEDLNLLTKDKKGKTVIYYSSYYKNSKMTLKLIRMIYNLKLDESDFNFINREVGSAANRFLLNDEVHDEINLLKKEAIKNKKDSL